MKPVIDGREKLLTIWSHCFSYCGLKPAAVVAFVYNNYDIVEKLCMDCVVNRILGLSCEHTQ